MTKELHDKYPALYGKNVDVEEMDARFASLISDHKDLFGKSDPLVFSAAGRTEIAGNHTDHNQGKVIGAAINLDTIAAVSARDDSLVTFVSQGFPKCTMDISDLEIKEEEKNTTASLLRGIARAFKDRNIDIKGWDANVTSKVLRGSGLSSSASVEVLIAEIFNYLYASDSLSPVELSIIGQYAENVYFGKPSGLLDQISCANGGIVGIDFQDKKNPKVEAIDFDFSAFDLDMIITDTRGCHADLTDEYAAVPPEMKAVAGFYGKENLREVEFQDFLRDIRKIRETLHNDRALLRAYHFFKENERVSYILSNLKNEDIDTFLYNVQESGNSSFRFLQNVYPSSEPHEQGVSLALALSEEILDGEGASRVHGGGFAGTIQAYVPVRLREKYIKAMENLFGEGCSTVIAIRSLPVGRVL